MVLIVSCDDRTKVIPLGGLGGTVCIANTHKYTQATVVIINNNHYYVMNILLFFTQGTIIIIS